MLPIPSLQMHRRTEPSGGRVALFVWGDRRLGGAERRFFRLFNHFHESGSRICLYTSESGAAACESLGIRLDDKDVHVFSEPDKRGPRRLQYMALIKRTLNLVRQLRKDRISHLHFGENPGPLTFLYGLIARLACPFSVSLVDPIKDYQRNARQKFYVAATARLCERIDCLSHQIRADLVSFLGGRYEHKCLVAPCSFTDFKAAGAAEVRDIDVSMIARMTAGKGHTLLRDALIKLTRAGHSALTVHVCGSGPLESKVRREFEQIENQQVHLHFEENPFRTLLRTKVFVSLQDVENYPSQSLLEAMACGCAIVATDVGLTRLLLDESCAVLVPRDSGSLAEALEHLLEREQLRAQLGGNARRVVTSTQTIERFAAYFITEIFGASQCVVSATTRGSDLTAGQQ